MPHVFVSRPATLNDVQAAQLTRWIDGLHTLGIHTRTLARPAYADPPWSQLRRILRSCDGVAIMGFARSPAVDRHPPSGPQQTSTARTGRATPWNHLEAGMAIQRNVPLLVVADEQVTEGVFAPGVWGGGVYGTSLAANPVNDPVVLAWSDAVSSSGMRSVPRCPEFRPDPGRPSIGQGRVGSGERGI